MATRVSRAASFEHDGRTIYLNNKELMAAVRESKEKGQMTDQLARMLQLLCSRYGRKGSFVNYSYNEDMQAYAMMMLVRTWGNFNPDKGSNPFAFYTQCVKNSFIQYLNQEDHEQKARNKMLIAQGLNPSYNYQEDERRAGIRDESDFDEIRYEADTLASNNRFVDTPIERDDKGAEIAPVYVEEEPQVDDTPQEE